MALASRSSGLLGRANTPFHALPLLPLSTRSLNLLMTVQTAGMSTTKGPSRVPSLGDPSSSTATLLHLPPRSQLPLQPDTRYRSLLRLSNRRHSLPPLPRHPLVTLLLPQLRTLYPPALLSRPQPSQAWPPTSHLPSNGSWICSAADTVTWTRSQSIKGRTLIIATLAGTLPPSEAAESRALLLLLLPSSL